MGNRIALGTPCGTELLKMATYLGLLNPVTEIVEDRWGINSDCPRDRTRKTHLGLREARGIQLVVLAGGWGWV